MSVSLLPVERSCDCAVGETSAVVNYPSPFTTPGAVVSNFPPSGSLFPAGTTVVSSTSIYDTNILHCTFLVTVLVRPTILVPPQNVVVSAGASTNFAVTAEGSAPLSYQWSFEGVPIAEQQTPR